MRQRISSVGRGHSESTYEELSLASKFDALWLAVLRGRRGEATREPVEEAVCSGGVVDRTLRWSTRASAAATDDEREPRISILSQQSKPRHANSSAKRNACDLLTCSASGSPERVPVPASRLSAAEVQVLLENRLLPGTGDLPVQQTLNGALFCSLSYCRSAWMPRTWCWSPCSRYFHSATATSISTTPLRRSRSIPPFRP